MFKAGFGILVLILLLFTGWVAYVVGLHTRNTAKLTVPGTDRTTLAFNVSAWSYPGATHNSGFNGGGVSLGTSNVRELLPGGRFIGASQTVTQTDADNGVEGVGLTTPDSLETVYAYYAQRLKLTGSMATFDQGLNGGVSTEQFRGTPTEFTQSVDSVDVENSYPDRKDVKQSVITCSNSAGCLMILLTRGRAEKQTSISVLVYNLPTHITTTVRNPPMLPKLIH